MLVLPAVLWMQSWHLLGFFPNPRTLGLISFSVAVALLGIVLFQDQLIVGTVASTGQQLKLVVEIPEPPDLLLNAAVPMSVFVLLWAIYSFLVAGVYLWGLDTRSLGFYSLFLWLMSTLFAVYFFVGDRLLGWEIIAFTWLLGAVAIMLGVLSALLFFYLGLRPAGEVEPTASPMRTVTGWFYRVFSLAVAVFGGLLLLGLDPLL